MKIAAVLFLVCTLIAPGAYCASASKIRITDAKIVDKVDQKLMPVTIMEVFPEGTSKVSCWFKWQNAEVGTEILAKWRYTTDNINVLDYLFKIPRKEGIGSVILSMPAGKGLPSGDYKIDLICSNKILKSLTFKVK